MTVVELRRYVLRPGRFDDLQDVFQRWLVDGQEQTGMRLGGQFRDRDDPDRFVWFRGFASMAQRHEALETFYSGPLWRRHSAAANATMIDTDDVLLLRPTEPAHDPVDPVPAGEPGPTGSRVWAVGQVWSHPASGALVEAGHETLERALGVPVAMWRTEPSPNTFERLPVRAGDFVVWLAVFADEEAWRRAEARLAADDAWGEITGGLTRAGATCEWMRLEPTATSRHPAARG